MRYFLSSSYALVYIALIYVIDEQNKCENQFITLDRLTYIS